MENTEQIKEVHVVNFIIHFTPSFDPPFLLSFSEGGISFSLGGFIHSAVVRLKGQECSNRLALVVRRFALHAGCLSTIEFTPAPLFQSSGQPVPLFFPFLSAGATARKKSRDWSRGYYQRVHTSRSPAELPMGAQSSRIPQDSLPSGPSCWVTEMLQCQQSQESRESSVFRTLQFFFFFSFYWIHFQ